MQTTDSGRESEAKTDTGSGVAAAAISKLDARYPLLSLLGLACWMAWNSIAFSGTFWFFDTTNGLNIENLIAVHLAASIVTLLCFALTENRFWKHVTRTPFVFAGATLAAVGTILIVVTRPGLLPVKPLFVLGCVCAGVGTTALFARGVSYLCALTPRRAFVGLISCLLVSKLVLVYLSCCPQNVGIVAFVVLPLVAAVLYSLHPSPNSDQLTVIKPGFRVSPRFALFLASIVLCSAALELVRAYVLIDAAPSIMVQANTDAGLVVIPLLLAALLAFALLKTDLTGKLYGGIVSVLVVLLFALGEFIPKSQFIAPVALTAIDLFNLVVWAMLANIAFQAQAGAIKITALGNAMLSLGTAFASLFGMAYANSGLTDSFMQTLLVVLGVVVLIDVLFVFNEGRIGKLVPPVDDALFELSEEPAGEDHKGRFVLSCEQIADEHGLSAREKEVFVELARGWTAGEIAEKEQLSIYTVRAHTRAIYSKLDVHSSKELREFIKNAR